MQGLKTFKVILTLIVSIAVYLVSYYLAKNYAIQVVPLMREVNDQVIIINVFRLKWCVLLWPISAIVQALILGSILKRFGTIISLLAFIPAILWFYFLPVIFSVLGFNADGDFGLNSYDGAPVLENTPYVSVVMVPICFAMTYFINILLNMKRKRSPIISEA